MNTGILPGLSNGRVEDAGVLYPRSHDERSPLADARPTRKHEKRESEDSSLPKCPRVGTHQSMARSLFPSVACLPFACTRHPLRVPSNQRSFP